MHPEAVAEPMNEIATSDAIFTADTRIRNIWSTRYIAATKNRHLIASFSCISHGSMANALPQAIGA
jgi:pyruvate dehydrogenase (quinone)